MQFKKYYHVTRIEVSEKNRLLLRKSFISSMNLAPCAQTCFRRECAKLVLSVVRDLLFHSPGAITVPFSLFSTKLIPRFHELPG